MIIPNKWSVEELIRHVIFTTEFWMRRIILQDNHTKFHSIGVENDTQATKWYSLDEITQAIQGIYAVIVQFLSEKPDYNKIMIFRKEEFVLKWILWHILQHELETWGQIAERIRTYGHPTPWEF
ncbi:MAG: DinB family protein [Candidatus Hodarchaeales archaeon]